MKGFIGETFDTEVEITENGVHYLVDVVNGQKTGFFWTRSITGWQCSGSVKEREFWTVLHIWGTFALNAGIAGASDVTGLDISEYAVQQANANAVRNHLEDTVHFRCANVLDELPKLAEAGEKYDVVILDPPAFTKSREATKNAIKGYREINMKGLKLVKDGGYLATCSCSHFYDTGTAGKDGEGSCKGGTQTAASGGIPYAGAGSSDFVGKFCECAGELLS